MGTEQSSFVFAAYDPFLRALLSVLSEPQYQDELLILAVRTIAFLALQCVVCVWVNS